ncbi:MAG: aminotransferase class I/II-fold pyridoxal phosphate-dependent enzyme [Bacteroides sp.]|nr:aminotransferase class I/II-fold pyridoxal phosphate-dependent enzyme [Bacteroides sp.]MCM1549021.1 aminotransferase class I/II-fold pyridoxal phosphate-dependent enzyme [Clostridium sp.]
MQAIILAAGMGKRLKELTEHNTKCMIRVNGETLIERMLRQLDALALERIVIVVGYKQKILKEYIQELPTKTPIIYVENKIYDKTNNIYSLYLAKDYLLEKDTLLLESDLIFEDAVLEELMNDKRDTLALVDKYESWMNGTCVKLGEDDSIVAFIPGKSFRFEEIKDYYKTVNVYKFSRKFSETHYVPFLEAYCHALGNNEYYEQVLRVITMLDEPGISAKRLSGQAWYEIDDIQDLDIAESMFCSDEGQRVSMLQKRYGGYWRYPKLIDFCYLVNPYFPPQKLIDELKANLDILLTQYPSGMQINTLLASRNFGVSQENILVGNGAAELIRSLMLRLRGKTGFVRPTFEEYPNRYNRENIVEFIPQTKDFCYNVSDLMGFFGEKEINNLILINPDNPSGNYICKAELKKLIRWTKERNIVLVVDESFVDFAEEEDSSLLEQKLLKENPHLVVMKSISKSYGIPGLRLGILASGNTELIVSLKQDVTIWNINSFAEFYMQIAEKYAGDYKAALSLLRNERSRFRQKLEKIPGLRVIPSQANYIMLEITNGMTAAELTKRMFAKHSLLLKDLTGKVMGGEFLRIAVRTEGDNDKLIDAFRKEFGL